MNRPLRPNALDRAVKALRHSTSALPDLYRALVEGELHALIPNHPEVVDTTMQLQNGSTFPFVRLTDEHGEYVPIFSSPERLEEGLERARVPPSRFACASLPAVHLMEILGAMNLRAVINKSCTTGELMIPPDMMRALADGSALAAPELPTPGGGEKITLQYVPADARPTALVQAAFEVLRLHAAFKVAWVFTTAQPPEPPVPPWHMLVLMNPRDPVAFNDLNIAISGAAGQTGEPCVLALGNETDEDEIARAFQAGQPFYVSPAYRPPR